MFASLISIAAITVNLDMQPLSLRVLTYNIHHGEGTDRKIDLPRLARVIASANPDLVALQEVDDRCRRSGNVNQTAELAKLTKLHGLFAKAIDYDGGEYGQALFSREPIAELDIHLLPGVPDRERRIAAAARIRVGKPGQDIIFITTHLHHARDDFREQQATELNSLFGTSTKPIVLAGDLNATPEAKPIEILKAHWRIATPSQFTFPAEKPTKVLDYILCRPTDHFRVLDIQVLDEPIASDHRPVLATLELRP